MGSRSCRKSVFLKGSPLSWPITSLVCLEGRSQGGFIWDGALRTQAHASDLGVVEVLEYWSSSLRQQFPLHAPGKQAALTSSFTKLPSPFVGDGFLYTNN